MRRLSGFLAAAASVLFILCALLTAVDLCCFDLDFYDSEYRKLDTARTIGIGHTSLMTVTDALLDYTRGGAEELDVQAEINGHNVAVFNEREVAHMADVRSLYTAAMTVRNLGLALCVLLFAVSLFIFKKERLRRISKCYFVGAVVCLVLFGLRCCGPASISTASGRRFTSCSSPMTCGSSTLRAACSSTWCRRSSSTTW